MVTFMFHLDRASCKLHSTSENTDHQLVLDVINGRDVILKRKTDHSRTQLWRMNASGNLVHFCSSTQKEFRKTNNVLVLDVEENSVSHEFHLVLNNLSHHRSKTQTWFFSSNYLKCGVRNYAIQITSSIREGSYPVLAPIFEGDKVCSLNTCVSQQKMRPGSGVLSARVFSKGPTQILEICDAHHDLSSEPWIIVDNLPSRVPLTYDPLVDIFSSTEVINGFVELFCDSAVTDSVTMF